jgi:hypothetical protein
VKSPWKSFGVDKDREYLALLTYLPLKHFRSLPFFVRSSLRIQRQLGAAPGLAGYSLDAELFRLRFWTLSAWENEEALQSFVQRLPHAAVMHSLASKMGDTAFIRWSVPGMALPLSWADAHERHEHRHVA